MRTQHYINPFASFKESVSLGYLNSSFRKQNSAFDRQKKVVIFYNFHNSLELESNLFELYVIPLVLVFPLLLLLDEAV